MEVYNLIEPEQSTIENGKFQIESRVIDKGLFYVVRWLWQLSAHGRRWQVVLFNFFAMLLLPVGFAIDLLLILLYLLWQGLIYLLARLTRLLISLIDGFFMNLVYPTLKTTIQIIVIISLAIILIYKFEIIKNFILQTFEILIK